MTADCGKIENPKQTIEQKQFDHDNPCEGATLSSSTLDSDSPLIQVGTNPIRTQSWTDEANQSPFVNVPWPRHDLLRLKSCQRISVCLRAANSLRSNCFRAKQFLRENHLLTNHLRRKHNPRLCQCCRERVVPTSAARAKQSGIGPLMILTLRLKWLLRGLGQQRLSLHLRLRLSNLMDAPCMTTPTHLVMILRSAKGLGGNFSSL